MNIITILDTKNGKIHIRSINPDNEDNEEKAFKTAAEDLELSTSNCSYMITAGLEMKISI